MKLRKTTVSVAVAALNRRGPLMDLRRCSSRLAGFVLALALFGATDAMADIAAFTLPTGGTPTNYGPPEIPGDPTPTNYQANLPVNLGEAFTVGNANISVVSLGIYDDSPYLTGYETVGLYTQGGSLLASTNVGPTGTDVNGYLYSSITPVVITANTQYFVVAQVYDNPWAAGVVPTTAPGISSVGGLGYFLYGGSLAFPATESGIWPAYYGPNLEFTATPEPGFYGLLGLGLTGLVVAARRRKRA